MDYTNINNIYTFKYLYDLWLYSNFPRITTKPGAAILYDIYTFKYPSSYILNVTLGLFSYLFGGSVSLKINFSLYSYLSRSEYLFVNIIINHLSYYNLYFTSFFFIREFIEIVGLVLKLKDFYPLYTYLQRVLHVLIIWDHKSFFLFLFSMFSVHFYSMFSFFKILGLRLLIRGKVSVGGNSRRRKLALSINKISAMSSDYRVYFFNKLLVTRTGALGFRVCIIYSI